MKTAIKSTLAVAATAAAIAGVAAVPSLVSAWGDNGGGRPSYTVDQINNGAIGPTEKSHGKNYKNSPDYPGQIIFNTISDSVIGDEKNFVGSRECVLRADNRCEAADKTNVEGAKYWRGNDITVEDGKTYIVRLYVHNNNPNGVDAVAENTKVAFSLPQGSASKLELNGFITSSNASPSKYWDYINFNSKDGTPFHLEYVKGSALLENNKIGLGGLTLSDDVVNAKSGGILIGYDALDGKIPGCYQYDNFVTIQVKAVYDYDFIVQKEVRLAGDIDKTWKESVEAKVGDKVEFQFEYRNTGSQTQTGVVIRDILPSNLRYVKGTAKLYNSSHPNGMTIDNDEVIFQGGGNIGSYDANANAFIRITAEVVDDDLACGSNTLINWAQVRVGDKTVQDDARVHLTKVCENTPDPEPTPPDPEDPEPTPTPELPNTGPEMVAGGVIATGSIATAAGYYIASRRQLR